MEKVKSKGRQRPKKLPLNVTGPLEMPREILPWERDLLTVVLEAVEGSGKVKQVPQPKVTS